jgi:hypothetical protein
MANTQKKAAVQARRRNAIDSKEDSRRTINKPPTE